MTTIGEFRKAEMLKLFGQKPRTIRDCAQVMGLAYDQIRYLVTQMTKDGQLFYIGFDKRQVVVATQPGPCLTTNQKRLMECLASGAKSGAELEKLLGLSVGRTYEALRNLREANMVYVQSKIGGTQIYAAGNEPDVVPKRRRRPPTKAERIARIRVKEERQRTQRLDRFERERQEGIAKNARMLPFAW